MNTNTNKVKELNRKRINMLFQCIRERSEITFYDNDSDELNVEEKIYDLQKLLDELKKEL